MLRDIFNTVSAKVMISLANLLLIILITNYLGAAGKGEMSLFVLNLSLVIMVNDFFGGAALVYIIPRSKLNKIISLGIAWALISSVSVASLTKIFGIDEGFHLHIFGVGFLHALQSIASHVLLSKEKIKEHNLVNLVPTILILGISTVLFYLDQIQLESYLYAMYCGYGLSAFYGFWSIFRSNKSKIQDPIANPIQKTFQLGFWVQIGNVIQLLNYRLAFYLMAGILDKTELGKFSTAINLAESSWLISKGISAIQYSKIANSSDSEGPIVITKRLLGLNFMGSLLVYSALLVIPADVLKWVFGSEFGSISTYLFYLGPGIIIFSVSGTFSHYFSGVGRHQINMISAIIGFVPTAILGPYLIEQYGGFGACQIYNVSYALSTLFLIFYFRKEAGLNLLDFIPSKSHIRWFKRKIRSR